MILQEVYDLLKTRYSDNYKTVTIDRIIAGIHFTFVQLSNGYCGIAAVDHNMINCCKSRNKDFGIFSPGKMHGEKLIDLINFSENSPILSFVKIAAINAVSAELTEKAGYKVIESMDPLDLLEIDNRKAICIVGAFTSYIKKIAESPSKLTILELDKSAIQEEYQKYFAPAREFIKVLPQSDIIIITGSTLVNNSLDELLAAIPPIKQVIIVGPSAGIFPEVLFSKGVNIIGSTKITDPDQIFYAVGEGASGYHLFHNGAKKICIINDAKKTTL